MSVHVKNPKAILTDTTKCIGCRECVLACKERYGLDRDVPRRWSIDDGLSARNWTSVIQKEGPKFVRKQCRHCNEPACVSVCPVGALEKQATGAVTYDGEKCMGCRYCMMACPYGIPRYDWDQPVPYVRKCVLCHDYIKDGGTPACTNACPTGATVFGDRDELLKQAWQRISDNPNKYNPHVWGQHEIGGTSVLYVSDIDLSFLSFGDKLGNEPLPARTKTAMGLVPPTFIGMAGAMTGIYWIVRRRMKNTEDEQQESNNQDETSGEKGGRQ